MIRGSRIFFHASGTGISSRGRQFNNLLLALASTVSLSFGICLGPRPYLCPAQYVAYFQMGSLLDSSFAVATGCGLEGLCSIPDRDNRLFCIPQRSDRLWALPDSFLSSGFGGLFPRGVEQQGREAGHSSPYTF
jgi:hypothetical protein